MTKTLVCSLPPLDQQSPPLAGAIVANICKQQGHEVSTVDLQCELNKFLNSRNLDVDYFSDVFYKNTPTFSDEQKVLLLEFIDLELVRLNVEQFDYIACSLFSFLAQPFGCIFLKQLRPRTQAKIIVGGAGLVNFKNSLGVVNALTFPDELKEQGIIDEYITGEAEQALPMYFNQGAGPGIGNGNFVQIDDLDPQPWPDYT